MSRERIVRAAMLAYPPQVRDARGGEMLDTALDVTRESPGRLPRESLALVRSGLRVRTGLTAETGTRRLTANVCAQGVTAWGLLVLTGALQFDRIWLSIGVGQLPRTPRHRLPIAAGIGGCCRARRLRPDRRRVRPRMDSARRIRFDRSAQRAVDHDHRRTDPARGRHRAAACLSQT
jgi:hypothetical protein